MGGGSLDAFNRGELLGDEIGHFMLTLADHQHREVEFPGSQVDGAGLGKAVDTLGDRVEADILLRRYLNID